jgi:hypothetical protein
MKPEVEYIFLTMGVWIINMSEEEKWLSEVHLGCEGGRRLSMNLTSLGLLSLGPPPSFPSPRRGFISSGNLIHRDFINLEQLTLPLPFPPCSSVGILILALFIILIFGFNFEVGFCVYFRESSWPKCTSFFFYCTTFYIRQSTFTPFKWWNIGRMKIIKLWWPNLFRHWSWVMNSWFIVGVI